jgi:hypothetical protein
VRPGHQHALLIDLPDCRPVGERGHQAGQQRLCDAGGVKRGIQRPTERDEAIESLPIVRRGVFAHLDREPSRQRVDRNGSATLVGRPGNGEVCGAPIRQRAATTRDERGVGQFGQNRAQVRAQVRISATCKERRRRRVAIGDAPVAVDRDPGIGRDIEDRRSDRAVHERHLLRFAWQCLRLCLHSFASYHIHLLPLPAAKAQPRHSFPRQ